MAEWTSSTQPWGKLWEVQQVGYCNRSCITAAQNDDYVLTNEAVTFFASHVTSLLYLPIFIHSILNKKSVKRVRREKIEIEF